MTKTAILGVLLLFAGALQAQKSADEKMLFQQLNQSRKEAGQPPLDWDEHLAAAARAHTQKMAQGNKLAHVLPGEPAVAERLATTGIHFNRSGENVGYNSDVNDFERAWMESPGHRENILNPDYTVVGIGIAQGPDGLYYATQDFAQAIPQRTPAEAEDLIAQSINNLRKEEGRPPLELIKDPRLHDIACEMAKTGRLNASIVAHLSNVRESLVYNDARPEVLPASAHKVLRNSEIKRFAVSSCFTGDRPDNPGGTYYVAIAFY